MEQKKIIQLKPSGHMLVKGVAGSGKTTVGIHRIPYLATHYCYDKNDEVLMITFNKTLKNYIEYLYGKVENEENQLSMNEIFHSSGKVTIKTIDKLIYDYYRMSCRNKPRKLLDISEKYQYYSKAISIVSKKYENLHIIDPSNIKFLMGEVEWINACVIENEEDYQVIDRMGRATNVSKNSPQKLLKNSRTRKAIFELKLVFEKLLEQDGLIDFRIMQLEALKFAKTIPVKKYRHIIIDESQDLSKSQLDMINLFYLDSPESSIMFIADNAQSIYPHSWLGKGRSYKTIGYDMSGKSKSLTKNYRTTTQIAEAAYDLLEKNPFVQADEDFVKPSLVDRKGEYPIYRHFETPQMEYEHVASLIMELKNDYELKDICIIAKETNIINLCKACLESKNINVAELSRSDPNFSDDNVKMTTMHSIKGLEFKVVIIIGLNDGVIPMKYDCAEEDKELLESEDRKLFYVGMTRANNLLFMSSSKRPSKFICEIDRNFLRLKRECRIKPYRQLKIEEYEFQKQIVDLYSKEESVRQWVISELLGSYGYDRSMLDIEYGVSNYSKKGFVDIAVSLHFNNKRVPFIFVEIKKQSVCLQPSRQQLFDYMASEKTVKYGVLTNGRKIEIFDRSFDQINDIPKFHRAMMPSTKHLYRYMNLRNNNNYSYSFDESSNDLEIRNAESDLAYDYKKFHKINVYGNIVAGIPEEPLLDIDGDFQLPEEWIVSKESTFILKVAGDSMKNAGIDIGDYVVVNKQKKAENMQIVVATLDGESTLKKFMYMGESILLIPENPDYEPINVQSEDFEINGIVIGVIKDGNMN